MTAALAAATLVVGGLVTGVAAAEDGTPSRQDVRDARSAVRDQAGNVAAVRARLAVANQRLEQAAVRAAQAAEAFNGARWHAAEAREQAASARRHVEIAGADLDRQRQAYGGALVTSYELAPGLSAFSAIVGSDGIDQVVEQTTTLQNAERALDANYDGFRAAVTLADVAAQLAEHAEANAARAVTAAREARAAARTAARSAAGQAAVIAEEKAALVERLAELQHVSVRVAQRRQSALEQQAATAAAAAAETEQDQAAAPDPQPEPDPEPAAAGTSQPSTPAPQPGTPAPQPSTPQPSTPQPSAPAPASGAQATIAFARAQIGEPYRWGAAGPDAWDCSGLTMAAWSAGGRSLPHYSVAQYEQSTPISAGQLRPGDLVFWGSSSDPGSIYHVALYVGDGRIVHAPRTGRPVTEESMYYWTPPNFYARA